MFNWMGNIFNWFKSIFSKVAKTAIGIATDRISQTALTVVESMENHPEMTGKEKFNKAFNSLRYSYPNIETVAINLAIEIAVALVKDKYQD